MVDLANIKDPADVRRLSQEECEVLADDIRTKIIQTTSQNGGHLSSNLGVVEITLALHRIFNTPTDKIVFDVGHQAYAHKLITGRYDVFDSLRTFGGISGFPRQCESEYDCFEAGHASTAISAALGLARARDAKGDKNHVIAVVGDGALTGGMCYEALNDCGNTKTKLIVILNDNEMSIAQNVGALSKHLSALRSSASWVSTKNRVKYRLVKIPLIGEALSRSIHRVKQTIKRVFIDEGFFTTLGFRYIGPIDGNDLNALEIVLDRVKDIDEPVVIHCYTKKGYGYNKAELKPEEFHGTPPFFVDNGKVNAGKSISNGDIANRKLIQMAEEDARIQVITAAMPLGTGTDSFQALFPQRFFDVGIAEEHAVTMSAGMAAGGMRPFFFVYSTFLQRGYDQVLHDVCIQNLPVIFMIDRAGLSNEDGQSHQGLYDFAYLRHIPNMSVLAPADANELTLMIQAAHSLGSPISIRYPKNADTLPDGYQIDSFEIGKWQTLRNGSTAALLSVGSMTSAALRVADQLEREGIELTVINASSIKPLDSACLDQVFASHVPIFTVEEHMLLGGFGSAVLEYAAKSNLQPQIKLIAVDDRYVQHGDHASLLRDVHLDDESIISTIRDTIVPKAV
ncbi:MAG: 1-deoxy-D-xylulose-5-phosphate synthase [Clostridiales bacterium]|nr:1-deoxy-D-xylulose-5-phosphate synthase [Clostridiales bacterium]